MLARPISPLKPSPPAPAGGAAAILTNMVPAAKPTRGAAARKALEPTIGAGRGKRAAAPAPPPKVGRGRAASDSSNTSGSTVIRKAPPKKVEKTEKAPAKRTVMSTIKGIGGGATTKKAPGPKAVAPTTGGRILRKRG